MRCWEFRATNVGKAPALYIPVWVCAAETETPKAELSIFRGLDPYTIGMGCVLEVRVVLALAGSY